MTDQSRALTPGAPFRRVLLKLSGEALVEKSRDGILTYSILDRIARRQYEHRDGQPAPAQASQDLQSAATRQAEVEHDDIKGLRRGPEIPILSGAGYRNVIALTRQSGLNGSGHLRIVFNH